MPSRPIRPARPVAGGAATGTPSRQPVRPQVSREPTLAVNFTVDTDAGSLSVARIVGLGLAGDPAGLAYSASARPPAAPQWSAPALPGRVTLVRAVDGDRALYGWRREAVDGKPAMRSVTIRQLDRSATQTLNAWRLAHAWPLAWRGPLFDAVDGGIAFEELDIVYADLVWL